MSRSEDANQLLNGKEVPFLEHDPALREIMKNYIYGDVYQHGSLSIELRDLILVVVMTANHSLTSLKGHLEMALDRGLAPEKIKEAIYQCTPYVGLGKVEEALEVVHQVFSARQMTVDSESLGTVNEKTRYHDGLEVQVQTFGEGMREGYAKARDDLKHINRYLSEYCFGDFYTRRGLDGKTRELLTMVMILTLGGCENQLRSHIQGNLALGNDRAVLVETITQCQPYIGFPRTLNAMNLVDEATLK